MCMNKCHDISVMSQSQCVTLPDFALDRSNRETAFGAVDQASIVLLRSVSDALQLSLELACSLLCCLSNSSSLSFLDPTLHLCLTSFTWLLCLRSYYKRACITAVETAVETTTQAAKLCKGEILRGSVCRTAAAEVSEAVQGFVLCAFANLLSNNLI